MSETSIPWAFTSAEEAEAEADLEEYRQLRRIVVRRAMDVATDPESKTSDVRHLVGLAQKFHDQRLREQEIAARAERRARSEARAEERAEARAQTQAQPKAKPGFNPQPYTPEVKAAIDEVRIAMWGKPPPGWTIDGTPEDPNDPDPHRNSFGFVPLDQMGHEQDQQHPCDEDEDHGRDHDHNDPAPVSAEEDGAIAAADASPDPEPCDESRPKSKYHEEKKRERFMYRQEQRRRQFM